MLKKIKAWLLKQGREAAPGLCDSEYVEWSDILWLLIPIAGISFFVAGPTLRRQADDWKALEERRAWIESKNKKE